MNRFFFITSYDNLSGSMIGSLLKLHPDIHCHVSFPDPFLMKQRALKMPEQTVDEYVEANQHNEDKFNGNIQLYTAFELQYKILTQRAHSRLIKPNITITPALRIQLILHSWLTHFQSAQKAVYYIEDLLQQKKLCHLPLFNLLNFDYFYQLVLQRAIASKIDLSLPENKLYLLALAKVLTHDTADLPTPNQSYKFENLISSPSAAIGFIEFLTSGKTRTLANLEIAITDKQRILQEQINTIQTALPLIDWQHKLLDYFLNTALNTIYYPHINKPLVDFYLQYGYCLNSDVNEAQKKSYSKLLSIHLNSNRPTQLITYFDNIESTCDHPEDIEVVVNIDDDDKIMEDILYEEMHTRRFTLKYTTSPKPASFCDLWKPINKLLPLTDENAYFLLNISDEMLFATPGWDTILKKYVGYFPDHLFRLRASRNKFRNYFDRWECSFAQDSIPITTKRWVDMGGDWNPCFGPDSFQQLVGFYLAKEGAFSNAQYLRELPLLDIKFHGDVPALGIEPHKQWKHSRDHVFAMQICQSYPMQLEARKRAVMIKATIIAEAAHIKHFKVCDDAKRKCIQLINTDTMQTIQTFDYQLSRLKITLVNNWRKLRFFAYFGEGLEYKRGFFLGYLQYLKSKYFLVQKLYGLSSRARILYSKILKNLKPENLPTTYQKTLGLKWGFIQKMMPSFLASNDLAQQHQVLKSTCHELRQENEKLYQLLLQLNSELPKPPVSVKSTENE